MRKTLTVLFALIIMTGSANAQGSQSVFFELGGPGLASFNFDTRFSGKNDGFGGRIGVGGFSIDGEGIVFFPLGVNYLLGKDGRNYFEIGGGVTPLIISGAFSDNNTTFSTTFGH